MPSRVRHCQRSFERYGVRGENIHKWMDEAVKINAGEHRQFRHDTITIKTVGEIFGKEYGVAIAENIALDHIIFDHEEGLTVVEVERLAEPAMTESKDPLAELKQNEPERVEPEKIALPMETAPLIDQHKDADDKPIPTREFPLFQRALREPDSVEAILADTEELIIEVLKIINGTLIGGETHE